MVEDIDEVGGIVWDDAVEDMSCSSEMFVFMGLNEVA